MMVNCLCAKYMLMILSSAVLTNVIFISQEKYLKDVLRKFGMQDCKGVKIPMPTNGHLCTDENGIDFDHKVYRSMIGSLLYLCASRPDIMLSVCMCARFQATPKDHTIRL